LWSQWDRDITEASGRKERESHPLFRTIRLVGEVRELPLLSGAINEIAFGKIKIQDKKIFADGTLQEQGVDLTELIEAAVVG
jgi:hypothetical protein